MTGRQKTLKGIMLGALCGILYGIYPALVNIIPFTPKHNNILTLVSFTMSCIALIFLFSVLFNIILIRPKKYFGIIKKFFKNKDAWKITLVNLLGAPVGMGFMAIGIALAGGALGKTFVALCIPITAVLERIFLKHKFKKLALVGILITTLSAVALGVFAVNPTSFKTEIMIGIIFCLVPAFAWAAQGVLMYKILHNSKTQITAKEVTVLKYIFALFVQLLIVLPMLTLINMSPDATFVAMGKIFMDYDKSLIIIIVSGFVLLVSYTLYIATTKSLGATMGIVFENLSIIFVPIFVVIFYFITKAINSNDSSLNNKTILEDLHHIKTWWFWTFSFSLLFGIILTVIEPKGKITKLFKKNKKDKEWEMYEHM